jgi:outer membrane protein assembly factor BamA
MQLRTFVSPRFVRSGLVCLAAAIATSFPLTNCWPAPTQQAAQGTAKLAEVTVEGSKKMSPEEVAAACGLKIGSDVTKDDLQGAANKLAQLGTFGSVNFHFETKPDGVHLHFTVTDSAAPPVFYDNFPWFTDDELNAAAREAVPYFDGTVPAEGKEANDIAKALEKLMTTRGVYGNVLHLVVDKPGGGGSRLQFNVEGSPVELAKLNFTDPGAGIMIEAGAHLPDVVGHPYSRYALELFAFEQIRPAYLQAGHLKVAFGEPQPKFEGSAPVGTQKSVTATLPITPGPVFRLGSITWAGNTALSATALNTLNKIAPNGVADGMALQATWQAVAREYAQIGYLDAKVDAEPEFGDGALRVNYTVKIEEGPQYKMGQLVVTGLSLDAEKRLRAAWAMQPGAVFDQAYYESFRDKLEKPSPTIFGSLPVHYDKEGELLKKDPDKKTVDVLLDYQ